MKKSVQIHKALKRRKYVINELNDIEYTIGNLRRLTFRFELEKKVLDFELKKWDDFSKTNKI